MIPFIEEKILLDGNFGYPDFDGDGEGSIARDKPRHGYGWCGGAGDGFGNSPGNGYGEGDGLGEYGKGDLFGGGESSYCEIGKYPSDYTFYLEELCGTNTDQ